jgi:hypothetical protein
MYFINSFTDTTGFRSPQSTGACELAADCAGGVFDEEHPVNAAQRIRAAHAGALREEHTVSTSTPVTRIVPFGTPTV